MASSNSIPQPNTKQPLHPLSILLASILSPPFSNYCNQSTMHDIKVNIQHNIIILCTTPIYNQEKWAAGVGLGWWARHVARLLHFPKRGSPNDLTGPSLLSSILYQFHCRIYGVVRTLHGFVAGKCVGCGGQRRNQFALVFSSTT
jgi:hypothetical protein